MIQIDDKELQQEAKGMRICGWESRNLGKGRSEGVEERKLAERRLWRSEQRERRREGVRRRLSHES